MIMKNREKTYQVALELIKKATQAALELPFYTSEQKIATGTVKRINPTAYLGLAL